MIVHSKCAQVNGATRMMGLLGESISHTLSPAIHNHSAALLNINAVYLPLGMPARQVEAFLKVSWEMGAIGFNVTTPHKALVASLVPEHSLASVNTLYRGDSWWKAASTDGEGFKRGLARMGVILDESLAITFLGAGGAVTAILQYMVESWRKGHLKSLPEITIHARRLDGQKALKSFWPRDVPLRFTTLDVEALKSTFDRNGQSLLVQATSAPIRGDDMSNLLPAFDKFNGAFCDLVYGTPSALYTAFAQRNLKVQDGKPMLIEQARLAQILWWGHAAPYDTIEAMLP